MSLLAILPPLVFDTVIAGFLTIGLHQRNTAAYRQGMPLVRLIIRDGLLFLFAIFATNIAWLLVFLLSTKKNVSLLSHVLASGTYLLTP
jgi:hypothetical protein